jgi:DnaJ-class molecular chaperone
MSEAKSLYDVLGVKRTDSCTDIKKAYLKLARTHHPDKGGSEEEFKKIVHASEVLTDERRRKLYDETGMTDEKQAEMSNGHPFPNSHGGPFPFPFNVNMADLFGGMFGTGGGGPQNGPIRKNKKPAPYTPQIPITLEQFYLGHKFDIKINRQSFCGECDHSGAKTKEMCKACNGQGSVSQVMNMGPMAIHTNAPCGTCQGRGEKVIESCPKCTGSGFTDETRTLSIRLVPGVKAQETFIFPEVCSDHVAFERPGDAHIVIIEDQKDEAYKHFKRIGDQQQDLETHITLSLSESLIGCVATINHHPGYDQGLFVRIPAGSFEGDCYRMSGLGMPIPGQVDKYGDLYLRIHVFIHAHERAKFITEGKDALFRLFKDQVRKADCDKDVIHTELFLYK